MFDPIVYTIFENMMLRAGQILQSRGFNTNIGNNPKEAFNIPAGYEETPAISIFPGIEEETGTYDRQKRVRPFQVIGMDKIGSFKPVYKGELIKADIEEAFTGTVLHIPFTNGKIEILPGDPIAGTTSGFTAYVEIVNIESGSWISDNAQGIIVARRYKGQMASSEPISTPRGANVATVSNNFTVERPPAVATGNLAEAITFFEGGIETYPQEGEQTISCQVIFNVMYTVAYGDPYSQ